MPTRKIAENSRQLPHSQFYAQQQLENASILTAPEIRFIKIRDVLTISGKSKSSVYAAIKKGDFPPPVKNGPKSSAWVLREIIIWAESRMEARSKGADLAKTEDGSPRESEDDSR